ncbi:MAG: hypothetical protein HUU01_01960 [Saprospiraceae bacterium]|nr:hypothetical protein [Saprospiraceae bacterium]
MKWVSLKSKAGVFSKVVEKLLTDPDGLFVEMANSRISTRSTPAVVTKVQRCRLNDANDFEGGQYGDYDVLGEAKVTIFA